MHLLDDGLFFLHGGVLELLLTDAARQDALRAQQHHRDEDDAVDDEVEPLRFLGVRYVQRAFARMDERGERTGRVPDGRSLAERLSRP